MQVKSRILLTFIFLFIPQFLHPDVIIFRNGKTLENIKVKVKKDTAEIYFENGKVETRNKSELKSIKLRPVSWNNKPEKPVSPVSPVKPVKPVETKIIIQKNVAEELAKLEQERETNFAVPAKVLEERKRHDFLMKERIRLQYTEGYLQYSGGQVFFTEIMTKNHDRFYVKNEYGLHHLTFKDFGEELIIETDKGKEKIDLSKMLAVKEEKYIDGFIYLANGEKFRGKIEKNLGDQVLISTSKGEMKIIAKEILFPILPKNSESVGVISIKEGDMGQFLFTNGQTVHGKLLRLSKSFLLIETNFGTMEMELANLVSATKEELAK